MVNKTYNSLFAIISPLVLSGKTGVLKVIHEYGQSAHIHLVKGRIEEIEIGRLSGPEAAKTLVKWISMAPPVEVTGPGIELPVKSPSRGSEVDVPSYTRTKS